MNLLIRSATIIDPQSAYHNQTLDILVENGTIKKIGKRISNPKKLKELKFDNLHISQGWFDSSVCFGEPGYEERETISNGLKTASASGFTDVCLNTLTNPSSSTGSDIAFLLSKAEGKTTRLHPYGNLSKDGKTEDLAELFDMKSEGAKAFYDYQTPIEDANFLKVAMQYSSTVKALICSFPLDKQLAAKGVMNEETTSTNLGLKGIPSVSEEIRIARDLQLLEYTEGSLHIPTISTAASVELIRNAKAKKLDVSCSVAIHNLLLTEKELETFNTNAKVLPPLRTENDRLALIEGLKDGTIDMVTSDHNPLDVERKKLEFDHADFGTIGLESAFGALNSIFPVKSCVKFLTRGKERFGINSSSISEGAPLNASLFNPDSTYVFGLDNIRSKSKNSIFIGKELKGKVYGIINGKKLHLNN